MFVCRSGSSPRVWGKHLVGLAHFSPRSVHPHVCGENFGHNLNPVIVGRFIPTCVGKTLRGAGNGLAIPVHPHVCGENDFTCFKTSMFAGSSPRVWGKQSAHNCRLDYRRGSSPRVWGKRPSGGPDKRRFSRFIPTCVGKTRRLQVMQDEDRRFIPTCVGKTGFERFGFVVYFRFIPTCVGKTPFPFWFRTVCPRFIPTCVGKTIKQEIRRVGPDGSSPRVWGKRFHQQTGLYPR